MAKISTEWKSKSSDAKKDATGTWDFDHLLKQNSCPSQMSYHQFSAEGSGNPALTIPFVSQTEVHSRLSFNRRGLVGMACLAENMNTSQFFFTLGPTPELTGKHTLFGRVAGDTLFNMLRLGEGDVGPGERPRRIHRIVNTTVRQRVVSHYCSFFGFYHFSFNCSTGPVILLACFFIYLFSKGSQAVYERVGVHVQNFSRPCVTEPRTVSMTVYSLPNLFFCFSEECAI